MLEEYLSEKLGRIPHRERAAGVIQDEENNVPGAGLALLSDMLLTQPLRNRDVRSEDFELFTTDSVADEALKEMIVAYYAEAGWTLRTDGTDARVDRFTLQQGAGPEVWLNINITNMSDRPNVCRRGTSLPRPSIRISCLITAPHLRIHP